MSSLHKVHLIWALLYSELLPLLPIIFPICEFKYSKIKFEDLKPRWIGNISKNELNILHHENNYINARIEILSDKPTKIMYLYSDRGTKGRS